MTKINKRFSARKLLVTFLSVTALMSVMAMSALAVEPIPSGYYQLSASSGSHTFNQAWQTYASDRYGSLLTYGYNTVLINEDYAWAEQSQVLHWAELKNANGWHYGPYKSAGNVSKIEVTHSGSSGIQYYSVWN